MALVDLGTGAGLGLQLDRYRYRIGTGTFGPDGAGLTLACEVRGPLAPPPAGLPAVATRIGVDLDPVDLADPAARAWLVACAPSRKHRPCPGWRRPLTSPGGIRPPSSPGTSSTCSPACWPASPCTAPIIVTDAYTAVFLPGQRRAELADILAQTGRRRPVTWLSLDPLVPLGPANRDSVQGLRLPPALVNGYQHGGVYAVLGARTFDEAGDRGRLLARAHPSGQWIEWLGT